MSQNYRSLFILYIRNVREFAYKENEFFPGLPSDAAIFPGLFFCFQKPGLIETDLPSCKVHTLLHPNLTGVLFPGSLLHTGREHVQGGACLSNVVHVWGGIILYTCPWKQTFVSPGNN